jgi:hypothetical protein
MVKRTAVVLSVFSLLILAAGNSFAFMGGCCDTACAPMFLPVPCPPQPGYKIINKTWECNIEGPCPAMTPAGCGAPCSTMKQGLCSVVANALGMPLDFLFGGCDGVYTCMPNMGCSDPCAPGWGPIPGALAIVPRMLAAPPTLFDNLW